ncbi:MAG: hypothetical protein H6812_12620 [Phycisphaeraceae bacterium]|nr:hypothetical protein [Phycisphaerales bacterium]MCB9844080.1 hypothetical protein [Phycisphaeraceae bacterium]
MPDKPRLPWYRPRNITLAIVLLIVGLLAFVVIRALTARPGSAIDYASQLNELARTNQPGDITAPNRWDEFIAILNDYKAIEEQCDMRGTNSVGERLDFTFTYDTGTVDASAAPIVRADAIACLEAIRASDIYDRLDTFIEPGPAYFEAPPGTFLMMLLYPNLGDSRRLTQACIAEFHIAIDEGRPDDAIRALSHALSLARIASHQPLLIGYLLGNAELNLALRATQEQALNNALTPDLARSLLEIVNGVSLVGPALGVGGEQTWMLDLIQRLHTDDGDGNGMFLLSEFRKMDFGTGMNTGVSTHPLVNSAGLFFPDKKTTTAKVLNFYEMLLDQAAMTPYARRNQTNLDQYVETSLGSRDILLRMVLPAIGSIIHQQDAFELQLDLTRIILALTIYRAEHGGYPDSLEALAPGYLAELPSDGFAPDGKYRYIRRTPTADDPREFILYSVGADFTDDAGKFVDNRDALRYNQPPMDFVFNPPAAPGEQNPD